MEMKQHTASINLTLQVPFRSHIRRQYTHNDDKQSQWGAHLLHIEPTHVHRMYPINIDSF